MAKLGRRQLARGVVRLLREQPQNRAHIIRMAAGHLVATKRQGQLHLLMRDIADELFVTEKHLVADVYRAFPTTPQIEQAVVALLKTHTGAATVEIGSYVQEDLIGGVIINTPRERFDASVKTQLKQIARGVN